MKQKCKHIIYFLISAVMMMGILCACGMSPEKKIEGYWVCEHPASGVVIFNFTDDTIDTIANGEDSITNEEKKYYVCSIKDYTYYGYGSDCEKDLDYIGYQLNIEDKTKLKIEVDEPYQEGTQTSYITYDVACEKDKIQITGEASSILQDILGDAGVEITGESPSIVLDRIDEREYEYITALRDARVGTESYLYGNTSAEDLEWYISDYPFLMNGYGNNEASDAATTILGEIQSEIVDNEVIEENLLCLDECWYDWIEKTFESE